MATEPTNPHDAFFKQYLSHPTVAADFLRQHLPAAVAQLLDLTQLRLEKDSFVDEKLRSYFSDLIYTAVTHEQTPLTVSLLLEHKSYTDEWVNFQVLRYQVGYWVQEFDKLEAERKQAAKTPGDEAKTQKRRLQQRRTLTPILVILVYHGEDEWKVALRFARHLTGMEDPTSTLSQTLGKYIPDFEPHFVDLSTIPDEAIQGEITTQLFVRVLKYIFTHGLGGQLDQILHMAADIMRQPSGRQMIMALLRYIARSGIDVDKEEMAQKFLELLPKEGGALMKTMAEEWIEEGKLIGLSEGEKKGRQEGRQEGQTKTILRILKHRFQPSDEALMGLEQLLLRIGNEADLNHLTDLALEGSTLESWVDQLTPFVPPQPTASPV